MKNILIESSLLTFPLQSLDDQRENLKGRSGVYGFINLTNGNCYIGSGVDLWLRLLDYRQPWYLEAKSHLPIVRAIIKYGLSNFMIVILEFTTPEGAVAAEQTFIDKFKPVYNILQVAGSSLGYKHSEDSKKMISEAKTGSTWEDERRVEYSQRQTGTSNTFYGKNHTDEAKALLRAHALVRTTSHKPSHQPSFSPRYITREKGEVEVRNVGTDVTTVYSSLRKAAKALGVSHSHLRKFDGLCYNNYHITIHKSIGHN